MRWAILLLLWLGLPVQAHEVRPAYLELREVEAGVFDVLWKKPLRGDAALAIAPTWPATVQSLTPAVAQQRNNAVIQTWRMLAPDLRGLPIGIGGLEHTLTDVLVRIAFVDGTTWVKRLTPEQPSATVPLTANGWAVSADYLVLGIEHILLGIDHLLFVLGLVLITRGIGKLVQTITAFTIAHSITLAAAALGLLEVPVAPVEAVIALSIVFVAREKLHADRGHASLALRAPWIVALLFGLLHGVGFAAALAETGLPQQHVPLALLFFNVGVEVGQLAFVALVLAARWSLERAWRQRPAWVGRIAPYAIGSVAMYWVVERTAVF